MIVDMSLQLFIKQFAESYRSKFNHLDVLIHNAAHFDIRQKTVQITKENIEKVRVTNHIGSNIDVTKKLKNHLKSMVFYGLQEIG